METMLEAVKTHFGLPGSISACRKYLNGHINDTYLVVLSDQVGNEKRYVFQRINSYVFKDPSQVMDNIRKITAHWEKAGNRPSCGIITFLDDPEGKNHVFLRDGCWRVCRHVENSVSFETTENPQVLENAGAAFGQFQRMFADFPTGTLPETIPGFHDTEKRFEALFASASLDPLGRCREADIAFFETHQAEATRLCRMRQHGLLPLRVTHNDTKFNNILMDQDTLEPLCVIDLDTVMPGLSVLDYGDAIRFAANTASEDEPDLSRVGIHLVKHEAFTKGFVTASREFLTGQEMNHMVLGAITITLELASRFLADHLVGDRYFRIHRPGQNQDRARCQMKLAQDMMNRYDHLCNMVNRFYG